MQLNVSFLPSLVLVEVFVLFGVDFITLSIVMLCLTIVLFSGSSPGSLVPLTRNSQISDIFIEIRAT